jgi:uncharacterized protein with ATP-grasp and redox domains
MKIQTECVPCLLKRIIFETELSTTDKKKQTHTIQNACKLLSELYHPEECSATIATKVHKAVYDTLGDRDPYAQLKQQSNMVAQSLVPKVEHLLDQSKDRLKTSMICSIIGNIMDFGIDGTSTNPEHLSEIFDQLYHEPLGHDDYPKVRRLLQQTRWLLLFSDNCGEIVFDKILARELKRFNPDMRITLVVRGEPIISDATLDDALNIGFDEVVDEVFTTGCFAIGVDFNRLPSDLDEALAKADLILCKGMANYESFSETLYHPVVYLLRTKCTAISRSMGLPLNRNVIKLYS